MLTFKSRDKLVWSRNNLINELALETSGEKMLSPNQHTHTTMKRAYKEKPTLLSGEEGETNAEAGHEAKQDIVSTSIASPDSSPVCCRVRVCACIRVCVCCTNTYKLHNKGRLYIRTRYTCTCRLNVHL